MSFREVQTATDVANYQKRLTDGYPDRPKIIKQMIQAIEQNGAEAPAVAELCIGHGELAQALSKALPKIRYVGLDFIQPFLDFTEHALAIDGIDASFVRADLTQNRWPDLLAKAAGSQKFNAIASMQSLHDVGDAESTLNIYRQSHSLLGPTGIFINADLITKVGEEEHARPGRLTVPHHLALFSQAGFAHSSCIFENESFAICIGKKA